MNNDAKHFWTKETEQAIITWVAGNGSDDVLYQDKIYFSLLFFSRYIIGMYAKNIKAYAYNYKELEEDLVTHSSSMLLRKFNIKKCETSVMSFIHTVMRNHIRRLYFLSTMKKRTGSVCSLDELLDDGTDEEKNGLEMFLHIIKGTDDSLDYELLPEFLEWWKENKHKYFLKNSKSLKMVTLILDIIEHPEDHLIESYTYSQYICKKIKVTREQFRLVLNKMERINSKNKGYDKDNT